MPVLLWPCVNKTELRWRGRRGRREQNQASPYHYPRHHVAVAAFPYLLLLPPSQQQDVSSLLPMATAGGVGAWRRGVRWFILARGRGKPGGLATMTLAVRAAGSSVTGWNDGRRSPPHRTGGRQWRWRRTAWTVLAHRTGWF